MYAEYKKEWMDTYLWILSESSQGYGFEEKMLLQNPGEGRLEFLKQEKEGKEYFCYKVTGKKALNSIYAAMPIGEKQIREILYQLFAILENGRAYLLAEESFVLSPDYIFATLPQMTLELCYVPGYGVPLKEQLEGLFEYLLNRVDYDDKAAVELLYDCYMFCVQEKGGLAEIKKRLEQTESESNQNQEQKDTQSSVITRVEEQELLLYHEENEQVVQRKQETPTSYVSWLTDRLFHRKKRESFLVAEETGEYDVGRKPVKARDIKQKETSLRDVKAKDVMTKETNLKGMKAKDVMTKETNLKGIKAKDVMTKETNLKEIKSKNINRKEEVTHTPDLLLQKEPSKIEPYLPETAKEPFVPFSRPVLEDTDRTVLLSVRSDNQIPELICERTGEVISITKVPFYIGSAKEYTDYVPFGADVSRMHCCISKKLENYYLSDLNSTNGTYHNQKEVVPGKAELLAANDEIKIASQIFYIKFPCH